MIMLKKWNEQNGEKPSDKNSYLLYHPLMHKRMRMVLHDCLPFPKLGLLLLYDRLAFESIA